MAIRTNRASLEAPPEKLTLELAPTFETIIQKPEKIRDREERFVAADEGIRNTA